MGRKIPPFAALRAFEAVARRGNLHAAGEELGISASAISHQLKALEDYLGAKLLIRSDNRLKITDAGLRFASELREGLDLLEAASLRVSAARERSRISICLFHSLAELWMVPLLGAFNRDYPDVHVSLVTEPEETDFSSTDIDIAISYMSEAPRKFQTIELFPEKIGPLGSPEYVIAQGPLEEPSDVVGHRLIYCSGEPTEWRIWAERMGISLVEAEHWLEVDTRAAVLQAGEEGLGLVMGRRPLADLALARGRLVQLFNSQISTGMKYFIMVPSRSWSLRSVRDFCSWLQSAARAENPFYSRAPIRQASAATPALTQIQPGRNFL